MTNEELEKIANDAVRESEEKRKRKKVALFKIGFIMTLAFFILLFSTLGWFASTKDNTATGMSVKSADFPFELKSTGGAGLYDGFLSDVAPIYADDETTEGHIGIKWNLTKDTSEMKNVYDGTGEPDLSAITHRDSEQYGLAPGDSGTLVFSILPNYDYDLTLCLKVRTVGYSAHYDTHNFKTDDDLSLVTNEKTLNYLRSHILFFYIGEDGHKHLLRQEGFDVTLSEETSYTFYWVWPAKLQEILDADIEGLDDAAASKEVRQAFFEHPEHFLYTIGNDSLAEITVTPDPDATAAEIETAIEDVIPLVSGRNYNTYSAMYNDADQTIGDEVNFLMAELIADLSAEQAPEQNGGQDEEQTTDQDTNS